LRPLIRSLSLSFLCSERAWVDSDIASVRVKVIVETADKGAATAMFEQLAAHGYVVERSGMPINAST
jgi:hypothetical protein